MPGWNDTAVGPITFSTLNRPLAFTNFGFDNGISIVDALDFVLFFEKMERDN